MSAHKGAMIVQNQEAMSNCYTGCMHLSTNKYKCADQKSWK